MCLDILDDGMEIKVSIIMATRNSERYIGEAIESVLAQSYSNFELIIVDGESSDRTCEIVGSFSDRRLKMLSEKDESMYQAINKGIGLATGAVLAILNSDDRFSEKDSLEKIMCRFQSPNVWGVYSNVIIRQEERDRAYTKRVMQVDFNSYFAFGNGALIPHTSLYLRRSVFEAVGVYDECYKYASDYDFILRVLKRFSLLHIDDYLFVFRRHKGSITASGKIKAERNYIREVHFVKLSVLFRAVIKLRFVVSNVSFSRLFFYLTGR